MRKVQAPTELLLYFCLLWKNLMLFWTNWKTNGAMHEFEKDEKLMVEHREEQLDLLDEYRARIPMIIHEKNNAIPSGKI